MTCLFACWTCMLPLESRSVVNTNIIWHMFPTLSGRLFFSALTSVCPPNFLPRPRINGLSLYPSGWHPSLLSAFLSACLCTATHSRCRLSGRLVLQRSSSQTIGPAADCKSFSPVIPPCRPYFHFFNVALSAASASYKYDGPDVVTSWQIMWNLTTEPDAFVCLQPEVCCLFPSFHPHQAIPRQTFSLSSTFPPLSWALSLQLHSPDAVTGVVLQFSKVKNSTHATLVTERQALFWHRRFTDGAKVHIVASFTNAWKMAHRAFLLPPLYGEMAISRRRWLEKQKQEDRREERRQTDDRGRKDKN